MLFAPVTTKLETRAEPDGTIRVSGAFPYGSATSMGTFGGREHREVFEPGAFEFRDVDLLSQHEFAQPLASTGSDSLTLRNGDTALEFEARIDPEVAGVSYVRDALTLIRSGLAKGLSPGFVVVDDRVNQDGDAVTRTVKKAELHELSIVTRAAYPQAQVEARNWTVGTDVQRPQMWFFP